MLKRNLLLLLISIICVLVSCTNNPSPDTAIADGDPVRGRELISEYGCPTCHVIPNVPSADNHVGPSLEQFSERRYIAGTLINTPENLIRWLRNPQVIEHGTAMPDMGISEDDAHDIAAYLLSLE